MIDDYSIENLINKLNDYCDQQLLLSAQNEPKIQKKKMYLCKYIPHDIPTFKIIDNNNVYYLKLSCLCKARNETFTFEEAFNNLVFDYGENINYDNYFNCQETDHEGKLFLYYCKICKKNLCDLCFSKFKKCSHVPPDIFIFKQKYREYVKEGELILNKLNTNLNIDPYIKKLFEVIYNNFKEIYNNYSYYDIINKFNELVSNNNSFKLK